MSLPGTNIKAFLAGLLLSVFILLPTAQAETSPDLPETKAALAGTGEQQAAVSLEQAIRIAKEAFTVPEALNEFSTGFDQGEGGSFWNLRWYRSDEQGGEMYVRVNSETGEIWSKGQWMPTEPGQDYQGLPKYSREQLQATAAALAQKLQPVRFKSTRLQPAREYDNQPLPLTRRGEMEYSYEYTRVVNGFPYTENGIYVSVSADTGQVTRFDLNWEDNKGFPAAAGMISGQQAEQIFRDEAGPQLYYFRERLPDGGKTPLRLVYRLPGQENRAVIDAISGEVISRENDFYTYYGMGAGGSDEMMKMANSREAVPLSPVEEIAVEEAKGLLTRDKALELAVKAVPVPAEYDLYSSRLEQDYLFNEIKSWHFSWQTGSGAERKAMDIAVNAADGELISFDSGAYFYGTAKSPQAKFSEQDAMKIATDYIKNIQPGKWNEVVYTFCRTDYYPITYNEANPGPVSYNFNWVRQANGAQFPDNGFNVSVDSATGEITSYRMTWWNVKFPSPQGVISQAEAADKYLREAPLSAAYQRIWSVAPYSKIGGEEETRLVYYTSGQNFTMLDAFTGQLLDYNGNPATPSYKDQKFTDLDGHPAREAVELLARSGIVTAAGEFRPNDAVTQAELITMLVKGSAWMPAPVYREGAAGQEPWYQQYYKKAVQLGIIQAEENPDPNLPVTREVLARLTVHAMNLYKVAVLGDIYKLDFPDAGDISEHLRGHVALAAGLGLIEPADGQIKPKATVTRGEAAQCLVRMLQNN